jgi:hypothetical protein
MREHGIPRPRRQVTHRFDSGRSIRVDFEWTGAKLVVEAGQVGLQRRHHVLWVGAQGQRRELQHREAVPLQVVDAARLQP